MASNKSNAAKLRQYQEMNELEVELKKTEAVLKKAEFQQLPPYKKLAVYFSKGLGLILGIGFIIILILAFS